MAAIGHVQAAAGNNQEAQKVLHELIGLGKQSYAEPLGIAEIYAALHEYDQAFQWLDRAYEERSLWLNLFVKDDPRLDGLLSDLRFRDLLQRMNLQS